MDREEEEEQGYNRRQAEPLFKPATAMISKAEIDEREDAYRCGNFKKRGCKIPKRHPVFPLCAFCKMLASMGTDFFAAENEVTTDEYFKANDWQREEHDRLRPYWTRWLNNYPAGATRWKG